MTNCNRVFVYGTLMRGQRAHHLLAGGRCLGAFVLENYAMHHLGRYPGIKPCPGERVYGEVYEVDDDAVEQMDRYEGNGSLYNRVCARAVCPERMVEVQVYVYGQSVEGMPLMPEPWGGWNPEFARLADLARAVSKESPEGKE